MTNLTVVDSKKSAIDLKAAQALAILNDSLSYFDADTAAAKPAEDLADQSAPAYYQAA